MNQGEARFIRSTQEKHSSNTHSSILDFNFPSQQFVSNSAMNRLNAGVRRQISTIRGKINEPAEPTRSGILLAYQSTETGFDPRLEHVPPGTYVEGYFQSYRYFSYLQNRGLSPQFFLREPSEWFQETLLRLQQERPIVVHVRRGDYKGHPSIGLLKQDYYSNAIRAAKDCAPDARVWVFSDEPEEVRESSFLGKARNQVWLESPQGTSPAEVMLLMSMGSVNVISNSTFSWWGAMIGPEKRVLFPSPWFKLGMEPRDLIPGKWMRVRSSWE